MRVRVSADLADIKRDLALLRGTLRDVKQEAGKPLPRNNPVSQLGVSAGQTANAMRQLPAQMQDVFVSLQGGMPLMTVLLQQGSQIQSSFGSTRDAIAGVGSFLGRMINPATVAAAAVGALALAWKQASDAQFELDKALIQTGGYAGYTSDELRELVGTLDGLEGVARGSAAKAVLEVAQSGRFAGEQFELVAKAAARLESSTGQAVDKTVDKFREIAKDPVQALLKLNETEHFLTQTQLARVQALVEEGEQQAAVTEALRIYAAQADDVSAKAEAALPSMSRLWRDVKGEITGAWGELGTYLGLLTEFAAVKMPDWMGGGMAKDWLVASLPSTRLRMLNQLGRQQLGAAPDNVRGGRQTPGGRQLDETVDSAAELERMKALKEFQDGELRYLDEAARKKRELDAVDKLLAQNIISQAAATERKRQIEESYARKTAQRTNADNNAAQSLLESIQRQITANQQLAETGDKLSASDRLLIQARQLLADRTNTMTAATRASLEALLPQLQATDDAAEATQRLAKATEALARQRAILQAQADNRARSNELDLMGIGRGADATAQLRRQLEIQREYADELKRLGDRGVAEDTASWDAQAENARRHRDEQLGLERQYQSDRLAMLADWTNGARAAWEDYQFQARNAAEQARGVLTNAFAGAEDAFVQFTQTGKLSFSDLANSIIADLTRIAIRQALVNALGGAMGSWFGAASGASSGSTSIPSAVFPNAKGGIYDSPDLHSYANTIVSRPTFFAFAKGAGLMGEAGPEAIMPLQRTADGRLGVTVAGSGAGAPAIKIELKNTGQPMALREESTQQMPDGTWLVRLVTEITDGNLASGRHDGAVRQRYNLASRGVPIG